MSGAGRWIKKNPLQAAGLIMGAAVGGPALMGLLTPAAGAATGAAAGELAGGLGAGAADEILSAVPATFADKFGTFAGNAGLAMDEMAPYAKLANQAQGLLSPDQQQLMPPLMQPRQQMMAGGGGGFLPYGEMDEAERRKRMASSGRFYG